MLGLVSIGLFTKCFNCCLKQLKERSDDFKSSNSPIEFQQTGPATLKATRTARWVLYKFIYSTNLTIKNELSLRQEINIKLQETCSAYSVVVRRSYRVCGDAVKTNAGV